MGKNRYERRKAKERQPVPPATFRQLEQVVIKRAIAFCDEYMATDGWSRKCERKAMLLNLAVEHLVARRPNNSTSQETTAALKCPKCLVDRSRAPCPEITQMDCPMAGEAK